MARLYGLTQRSGETRGEEARRDDDRDIKEGGLGGVSTWQRV